MFKEISKIFGRRASNRIEYSGDYPDWASAQSNSIGYDSPGILEKVRDSLLKVKEGKAAYERDSVLFDRIEHNYPLLVALLRASLRAKGHLNVVDIGGSLGSAYFQCRGLLSGVVSIRWNVVEQENFVACGKSFFEDDELKFYEDLEACVNDANPSVVLLSSVLPYVESPHGLLESISKFPFTTIIIDRTQMWSAQDRITVQSVPASIYGFPTSYPARILNQENVLRHFLSDYDMVDEFEPFP